MKNLLFIIAIIFSFTLIKCNKDNKLYDFKNDSRISKDDGEPIDSNTFYFPLDVFIDSCKFDNWKVESDTFSVSRFSKVLFNMNEPVLYNKYLNKEIYQLTLLRSFDSDIVIRLEKSNDSIFFFEKTYFQFESCITDSEKVEDGVNIVYLHDVTDSVHVNKSSKLLSIELWDKFEKIVNENNFQLMPTTVAMDFGPDGKVWILEKHTKKGYYVVKRTSYGKGLKNLIKICDFLINNSRFKILKDL